MTEKLVVELLADNTERQAELEKHLRGEVEPVTAYKIEDDGTVTELEGVYPKPPEFKRVVRVAEELGNTIDLTEERVGV